MIEERLYTRPAPALAAPKASWKRWAVRLSGTFLLLFFLWKLNLNLGQVAKDLLKANLVLLAAAVGLILPILALKALRWRLVLQGLDIQISFGAAFRLYALGLAAGSFTPGQLGDTVKAWYLRDQGYSLTTGLMSVVLDRLFDLVILALLATSGLLLLGQTFLGDLPAVLVLTVGLGAALLALWVPSWRARVTNLAVRMVSPKTAERSGTATAQPTLRPANFGQAFVLSLLAAAVSTARIWLLALALGLNLNFLETVAVSNLAFVAGLIPLTLGGIGTRDLALVGILSKLGYAREIALSLSTFMLLLNLVNLVVGYAIWFARPTTLKEEVRPTLPKEEVRARLAKS